MDSRAIGDVATISMKNNFSGATYYTVTVNAVLTDNITDNQNVLDANGDLNSDNFREWTPIGYRNYDTYYIAFSGIFDGNGKSISGLVYNHYGTDIKVDSSVGLFSYIHGAATIKNTTIADSYFAGSANVGAFAGFAGEQQDQKVELIENCVNKATVKGYQCSGGIVGKGYLTINNCRNEGKVLAFHQGGGIAGFTEYDTVITNTVNTGDVVWVYISNPSKIVLGGFVGYVGGRNTTQADAPQTFKNCYNTGNVIISSSLSTKYANEVGGFFGYCGNAETVENCYNYGKLQITGTYTTSRFGSFAGYIYESTVTNCYYNTTDATYGAVNNADSAGVTGKEASAFESGEVCYLLNGSTSEGDLVWYQTIGEQTTPQFSGKTVYYDESATPQYYNEEVAAPVTITFDTNGGSEIAAITQDPGTAVTKPQDPTKDGCTFMGWDTEIPATMPEENITVKAQWYINSVSLSFTEPAVGAKATEMTIPANAPYTATTEWEGINAGDTFALGESYMLTVTVEPSNDHFFSDATVFTVNEAEFNGTVEINESQIYIENEYYYVEYIDEIDLSINAADGTVIPAFGVPDGAKYSVSYEEWFDLDSGSNLADGDTLSAGHIYSAYVEFEADAGYEFADDVVFKVNGVTKTTATISATSGNYSYMFNLYIPIEAVTLTVDVPKYGDSAPTVSAETNANYTINYTKWLDPNSNLLDSGFTFGAGKYTLVVDLDPAAGYKFTDTTKITVNGNDVDSSNLFSDNAEAFYKFEIAGPVASVTVDGETMSYTDLDAAVSAAASATGESITLTLLDRILRDSAVTISSGKFTIDLNGKVLTSSVHGFIVEGSGTQITFKGTTTGSAVKSTGAAHEVIRIRDGAEAIIEGGSYDGYAAVVADSGTELKINGGTFHGSATAIIGEGNLAINGGTFSADGFSTLSVIGTAKIMGGKIGKAYIHIDYFGGSLDLSEYADAKDLTICNDANDTTVSGSGTNNITLPTGYALYDDNGQAATTLTFGTTYTVGEVLVASVTIDGETTSYTDLDAAVSEAASATGESVTLTLLDHILRDSTVTIESGKFTIDLNGKILTSSSHGFWVYGSGTQITFKGTTTGSAVKSTEYTTAIHISDEAEVIIESGSYEGGFLAVDASADSELKINGGTFLGNEQAIASHGNLAINGGTFSAGRLCTMTVSGTAKITGGKIEKGSYNHIDYSGGYLDLSEYADVKDLTVCNYAADTTVSGSGTNNITLPKGYALYDANDQVATTLAANTTYTVGEVQVLVPTIDFLTFDGYQVRMNSYNGLRSRFTADLNKLPTLEDDGYEVIEYGTVLASSDKLAANNEELTVSGSDGLYSALSYAAMFPIYKNGANMNKYMLNTETNILTYYCTVTYHTVDTYDKDVTVRGYAIVRDSAGNEYVLYVDYADEDYRSVSLETVCDGLAAEGSITEESCISYRHVLEFRAQKQQSAVVLNDSEKWRYLTASAKL